MRTRLSSFLVVVFALAPLFLLPAQAEVVQILHTNDLHSQFEASELSGGYAALKATLDRLKNAATQRGIETITLDAGDFSEGSIFYLGSQGIASWEMMNDLGYDVLTLGNHDWLSGTENLDTTLGIVAPHFALVASNFFHHPKFKNLSRRLTPYHPLVRSGVRIAVLGITNPEPLYRWRAEDAAILPESAALLTLPEIRKNNDFVIALTHLGLDEDIQLIERSVGIDFLVGGHSHSELAKPLYEKNFFGTEVPIVQAGSWGRFVGVTEVDLVPGEPLRLLSYRLEPVRAENGQDARIRQSVLAARQTLDQKYGSHWLSEIIGTTEVSLSPQSPTWNSFVADAMRVAAKTEIAIHVADFSEGQQLPGPLTRENLFALYPRVFETSRPYGWDIWKSTVRGAALRLLIEEAHRQGMALTFSGLPKTLELERDYIVAIPEGVGLASVKMGILFQLFIKDAHSTSVPIWIALTEHLREIGTLGDQPDKLP